MLIQVLTYSFTCLLINSLTLVVEGMETCFAFDTSNSGPVSYDMEVSTDDLVDTKPEIKPEIMYFKKDLISNTSVLGIPPGTYS